MNPRVILDRVCAYYGLAPKFVLAGKRSRVCVVARRMTVALSTDHTVFSGADIAAALGLDHSTVQRARIEHAQDMARSPNYARDVRAIAQALGIPDGCLLPERMQ